MLRLLAKLAFIFLCLVSYNIVFFLPKVSAQSNKKVGCVVASNDRAQQGDVKELSVQVTPTDQISQTHADFTFQFLFNKTFSADLGDTIYAQVNFSNFWKATDLRA